MKYIIEFEDEPYMREDGVDYYTCKSARWYKLEETIINRLTPYTEPDRKAIEDEVWEFVRICLVMDGSDFVEAFDSCSYINLLKYSYQEAKAKYEAWLKQKDEIRVGDEVGNGFVKGTAFFVDETMVEGFFIDDDDNEEIEHFWWNKRDCKKTGRHFDEVADLLEKMRGEEE